MIRKQPQIQGNGFTATIIRTPRRKTASVKVENGIVSIVVPQELPNSRIKEVMRQKSQWIQEKLRLHNEAIPTKAKEYISGEAFSYLGRNYRLKVIAAQWQPVRLLNGKLTVWTPEASSSPERIRAALMGWYQSHARKKLREKTRRYAKTIGVTPKSINIKAFQSRWGSCHVDGHIHFNWKIIIAPNHIVDYVVVHELCHLKQPDHSPEFWKCVEMVIPDYRECREWLKVNGVGLVV
ncbi:MAG: M48 family metallopeptidase [Magnetococcales bacterium]|nr:M48 family metallopeptidase [Magnetococcales bacterium]